MTGAVAALPMYDPPALEAANDALWTAIAARLRQREVDAPDRLTRGPDLDAIWRSPRLLLAQACGYPLVGRLDGLVQLVATPRYRAPGCEGARHRAAIVVGAESPFDDLAALRGRRCAINSRDSNTGMNLLRARIAPLADQGRFFAEAITTGSHAASLDAVAGGDADVAAIDAVTLALLTDADPALTDAVRVLDWTDASPGLPLITAAATPPSRLAALRDALDAVAADPALAEVRAALRLEGFSRLSRADYDPVAALEQDARRRGVRDLA